MPLTKKGTKILKSMKEMYGEDKGVEVFYSSINKGVITGVHKGSAPGHTEKKRGKKKK